MSFGLVSPISHRTKGRPARAIPADVVVRGEFLVVLVPHVRIAVAVRSRQHRIVRSCESQTAYRPVDRNPGRRADTTRASCRTFPVHFRIAPIQVGLLRIEEIGSSTGRWSRRIPKAESRTRPANCSGPAAALPSRRCTSRGDAMWREDSESMNPGAGSDVWFMTEVEQDANPVLLRVLTRRSKSRMCRTWIDVP